MKLIQFVVSAFLFSTFASANESKSENKIIETRKVAQESDGCTFNFSGTKPLLDSNSKKLSVYLNIAKDSIEKVQLESALLSNGQMVVVNSGGCAHVGQAFSYSVSEITTDAQAVAAAIKSLNATPTTEYGGVKNILLDGLKDWKKKPTPSTNKVISFGTGDATLTLKYNVKGLLRVEYDFSL